LKNILIVGLSEGSMCSAFIALVSKTALSELCNRNRGRIEVLGDLEYDSL
jgi:hypothetical protein